MASWVSQPISILEGAEPPVAAVQQARLSGRQAQQRESTQDRYDQAFREPILARFASRRLLDTRAEDILQLLKDGTVSTNMYFRRVHSYALPWPILNYRQWPSRKFKVKRGVTWEEHCSLVETEKNAERKAYLELLWHVGAAQIDLVSLTAGDVDWNTKTITFFRRKAACSTVSRAGSCPSKDRKRCCSSLIWKTVAPCARKRTAILAGQAVVN